MMKIYFMSLSFSLGLKISSFILGGMVVTLILTIELKHDMDWFLVAGGASVDTLSVMMMILSGWIIALALLASLSLSYKKIYEKEFSFVVSMMFFVLLMAFSVDNLISFYIFFEASLIPIALIILGWGYQPERLQASIYILLYTVAASLPLLLGFLSWAKFGAGGLVLNHGLGKISLEFMMLNSLVLAFFVKAPVYFMHLWLPKAHVEAPVAGSMVLAGVLLKLGGYGLIRVISKLGGGIISLNWFYLSWVVIGGIYAGLSCLRQIDLKSLIALSSVAHMAMVMSGILTKFEWGVKGAIIIMIGHGFSSSGLFSAANSIYMKLASRSLNIVKGLSSVFLGMTIFWFVLSAANMGAPPSLNLAGEILVIVSLIKWAAWMAAPLAGMTFLAAAYSLMLFSKTQHGKSVSLAFGASETFAVEFMLGLLHAIPIFMLVIYLSLFSLAG